MSDTPDSSKAAAPAAKIPDDKALHGGTLDTTTLGERLQQAREQAGLSIEKVAKDLFLDVQKIRWIETNNFKELGAPVYAKGYLKRYTRLVGLNEAEVLQRYAVLSDAAAEPALVPVTMGSIPESRPPLPGWVLWVVIALILLAGVATLLNLHTPVTPANQGALISQPLPAPESAAGESVGAVNAANAVIVAGAASGTTSGATAGAMVLRFKFSGDSWVEVYDLRNQPILYDMGTANTSREISGKPPLRVVLGAAAAVSVQVNSQAVIVPATHIDAGVARFVLKPDGTLE
jgi:cytoskeleton protein RodZ